MARAKVLTAMGCCDGALGARADPLQPTETAPTEALPAAAPADPGLPILSELGDGRIDYILPVSAQRVDRGGGLMGVRCG